LLFGVLEDVVIAFFVAELATASWVVSQIYRLRRSPGISLRRDPAQLWAVIAFGFAFLAFDEALSIHERADVLLHWLLSWEETALTDRIDDVIILAYGLAGLALLYWRRAEALRCRVALPWLALGFALLSATVILDVVTNREDILEALIADEPSRTAIHLVLSRMEESTEVLSQTAFLLGFLACLRTLRRERQTERSGLSENPA
jgi:hypothetical protein